MVEAGILRREALVVAAIAAVVYRLTLSAVPALTHDSTGYLLSIEAGGDALFHPHHLAYNAMARVWLDIAGAVGMDGDPLRTVEMLNALIGACAVALVWTILRFRAQLPRHIAAAGTAGAALSYGLWFYSVSVEVYVLPLVFLLACFLVLTAPRHSSATMLALGVLNGLAVVAHQVNVLFAIVVVTVVARHMDRTTAIRRIATYGAAAAGVVAAAYGAVLAFAIRPGSPGEAADWFTRYAQVGGYWHITPDAPVQAASGFARSVIGGHFAYRLDPARQRVESMFPSKSLVDETFLVREMPGPLAVALTLVAVAGAALLLATVARGVARRAELTPASRRLVGPLLTWLVVYSALFLVWEPTNPEFWIPQATVLWMAAAVGACPSGAAASGGTWSRRGVTLAAAAIAIGFVNLVGTIVPATAASNDIYAVRYRAVGAVVDAGDVIVVDHPHLGVGYADRSTDAEAIVVSEYTNVVGLHEDLSVPPPAEVADRLAATLASGNRVVIDAHLIERPTGPPARLAGEELAARFRERWRHVDVPGALGWYVIDP